jgi:hypothetical protein
MKTRGRVAPPGFHFPMLHESFKFMGAISVPLVTITCLWDDFPSCNVSCLEDCKNSTDRLAKTKFNRS